MSISRHLEELSLCGLDGFDVAFLRSLVNRAILTPLRCMQHPLGFYHFLLHTQGSVSLRLHYWPAHDRPISSAVTAYHDHVWALQSCILAGTIENVLLTIAEDRFGTLEIASIQQIEGVDQVVPEGHRVRIHYREVIPYSKGDVYRMAPGIFHCTQVNHGIAAVTIVRAEVVMSGGPRTLVPFGYSGQAPRRIYLNDSDQEVVRRAITNLLS